MMEVLKRSAGVCIALSFASVAFSQGSTAKPSPETVLTAFLVKCQVAQTISTKEIMVRDVNGIPVRVFNGSIKAKKPNYWVFETESVLEISNGQKDVAILKQGQTYTSEKSPAGLEVESVDDLLPPKDLHFDSLNFELFDGVEAVHGITVLGKPGNRQTIREYWIDPVRLVPLASRLTADVNENTKTHLFFRYINVAYDIPMTVASDFSINIPAGTTLSTPPPRLHLAVGSTAPPLSLRSVDGNRITLAKALKNHKGVILNFWFVDCAVCRREFPHLEGLYDRFKTRGLAVYAIDRGYDNRGSINQFMNDYKLSFPALINEPNSINDAVRAYGISGFPTNYLITPDGRISAILVGYEGDSTVKEMEDDLKKMGIF